MGLAYALARIEQHRRSWMEILLPGWGNPQPSWLRSHPPTEERIKRLQNYAAPCIQSTSPLSNDLPIGYIANQTVRRSPHWRIEGFGIKPFKYYVNTCL